MKKTALKLVSPNTKMRTVTPTRKKNSELRTREHLDADEVEKLIKAASKNRYGQRDACMIRLAYRHGLRASEVCELKWEQVNLKKATLHVNRKKSGSPSTHPIKGDELRALGRLHKSKSKSGNESFVFVSERGAPFTRAGFAKMVERAGKAAKLAIKVHAHMLRHACGYKLANAGRDTRSIQAYLGHRNIQHTTRYTEMSESRFKDFWPD